LFKHNLVKEVDRTFVMGVLLFFLSKKDDDDDVLEHFDDFIIKQ
jgi:hypothetical protein